MWKQCSVSEDGEEEAGRVSVTLARLHAVCPVEEEGISAILRPI